MRGEAEKDCLELTRFSGDDAVKSAPHFFVPPFHTHSTALTFMLAVSAIYHRPTWSPSKRAMLQR